ncbi:MAG TPA: GIY-YIG nuclease family protein [Candidatus Omnitrophota bacterium]|nr:GIY-YIG nuclease family protein [Candidatus Omnitrophota bacterium]
MYYVYLLKEKGSNKTYIGFTANLEQRLKQHKATKEIELIYYEAYKTEKEARDRERKLKMYGSAWRALRQRLRISLSE